ncbi:hypothetical protein J1N35_040922, partial [Gossypium stocksii]
SRIRPCLEHVIDTELRSDVRPCLGHGMGIQDKVPCKTMSGTWLRHRDEIRINCKTMFGTWSGHSI